MRLSRLKLILPIVLLTLASLFMAPASVLAYDAERCFCYYNEEIYTYCLPLTVFSTQDLADDAECKAACQVFTKDKYDPLTHLWPGAGLSDEQAECERVSAESDAAIAALTPEAEPEEPPTPPILPRLSVEIPGVSFTEPLVKGDYLEIGFIGQYIAGLYSWMLGAGTLIAVVMVMIGGLQYMIGKGVGDVQKGKDRIKNAVIGLVLLLGSYTILYTVNPDLILLQPILVEQVQVVPFEFYDSNLKDCPDVEGMVKPCTGATEIAEPGGKWTKELSDLVNEVAAAQNVDPFLMATHLQIETSGNANWTGQEIGPCGEIGPAQFMPSTFDSIVGTGGTCCIEVARPGKIGAYADRCTVVDTNWPPAFDFPDGSSCATSVCGICQVASSHCINHFDTSANPNALRNAVEAQAKFIRNTLNYSAVGGDIARELCAYNGSGERAAAYAKKGSVIYAQFCKNAGGTQ